MALWGNKDTAANRPKYANTADVTGITVAEATADAGVAHPGWVKVTKGTGSIASVTVSAGGTGYANGDVVTATGEGEGFAGTVRTNASGVITSINVTAGGTYTAVPTLAVTSEEGAGATLTAVVSGGRFGREFKETLVAMNSMTN